MSACLPVILSVYHSPAQADRPHNTNRKTTSTPCSYNRSNDTSTGKSQRRTSGCRRLADALIVVLGDVNGRAGVEGYTNKTYEGSIGSGTIEKSI
jgi:hypothetical protein